MPTTHSTTTDPLPLRHRLYARYCDGLSAAAIAREFALDRQTVTRHLRIIEEQLNREHTRDLERLRVRALHAQYRIQATALAALEREEAREDASLEALAVAQAAGTHLPPLYHAQRARLLAVAAHAARTAAHAARTAAQLQGLFYKPSAALIQAHPWITPYPPERFHIHPAPDPAPDLPDDAYDPTDPDDQPDDDQPDDDQPDDDQPDDDQPDDPGDAGDPDNDQLDDDDQPDGSDDDQPDPSDSDNLPIATDPPDNASSVSPPPISAEPAAPAAHPAPAALATANPKTLWHSVACPLPSLPPAAPAVSPSVYDATATFQGDVANDR